MDAADVLWAKLNPYKSLIHHMIDAGACAFVLMNQCFRSSAEKMAEVSGMELSDVVQISCYITALHDIGKCHPGFQYKAKDVEPDVFEKITEYIRVRKVNSASFRHELYSEKILRRIWAAKDCPEEVIDNLSVVTALHHQGKKGNAREIIPAFLHDYQVAQDELEKRIRELFPNKLNELKCSDWSCFCILLEGIMICSDWISSDEWFENLDGVDDQEYLKIARNIAASAISEIGISETKLPDVRKMEDLFPYITASSARPMQKAVSELKEVPCFAILEDLTGSGKTEAAVYLASRMQKQYEKHGFYFALPTSATSNQMYFRLAEIFRRFDIPDFKLLHGTAWAVSESGRDFDNQKPGTETIGNEWLAPARKGLLAENAVGTVDQAMMSVLRIKYSVLRLLGLSEKVLIIDEVHAYDAYMSDIIEKLLMWCRDLGIPVIMLSATLPIQKKSMYLSAYKGGTETACQDYPLLTALYPSGEVKEIPVNAFRKTECYYQLLPILTNYEAIAELALSEVKNGGNLCVMANTIKDARKIFGLIKNKSDSSIELMLFHACFTVQERNSIEQKCLRLYGKEGDRPKKSILVCTQVVEQSLDIDFDEIITQIAPIDLLIQRAGRIHRHQHSRPESMKNPRMIILTGNSQDHSGTYYVYAPYILNETMKYLTAKQDGSLLMPDELRSSVESVYSNVPVSLDDEEWQKLWFTNEQKQNNALGHEIEKPSKETFFEAEKRVEAEVWEEDPGDCDPEASTRDGRDSVRVVLADEDLYQKYQRDWRNPDIQKEMLLCSVSLHFKSAELPEAESRGRLKGYLICHSNSNLFYVSESITLIDDPVYGVILNEKGSENSSSAER